MGRGGPVNGFDLSRQDPNNLPAGTTLQPTHPNLLTLLAYEFAADKFDLRSMLRTIALSNAYQMSTTYTPGPWSETWTPYFARHLAHRLTAEETLDAIATATNVPVSFTVNGVGTVNAAMKMPDTTESARSTYGRFLDEFGRGDRDSTARSNDTSIAQSLSLMNDPTVVVNRVHRNTANSTVAK